MGRWTEAECKVGHDPWFDCHGGLRRGKFMAKDSRENIDGCVWSPGPVIVGAGPSGLAVAACLQERGIPSVVLERAGCIASLWQLKTYDRLRLHLPKQFCELPRMPFPACFPKYPDKQQFVGYLEAYARAFDVRPRFHQTVVDARYDAAVGLWRVLTSAGEKAEVAAGEYFSRWLVVATGENAEVVVPDLEGAAGFRGTVAHTSSYKNGDLYRGKRVLVVGCGNSGMEVCLDLCNNNALPTIVVRDSVHILPRELLGCSTFGLSMWLLRWLPIQAVDLLLLLLARLLLGDTGRVGLMRPRVGPLQLKLIHGKTPVIDVGALRKIKSGDIKVRPALRRLTQRGAEFADGRSEEFDAVIFATGYKSNVPSWLKEEGLFSSKDGLPTRPFPHGWKGDRGLYAVGFTKRGLMGASLDARRIAQDIEQCWKSELKEVKSFTFPTKAKAKAVFKHESATIN